MSFLRLRNTFVVAGLLIAIALVSTGTAIGQSSDQDLPTPVHSFDITGTIPALDVGDPRVTRRFYAFNGTHGDLLVTVESKNLNGDVDIFTAVTFKPLLKIPMYGQASSSMTTKSIYMRSEEVLVLRIEARSPNDDTGQYHIRFGGAFAPFSGGIPVAEDAEAGDTDKSSARSPGKGTRRVSSVGASVTEPAVTMLPNRPSEDKPSEAVKAKEEAKPKAESVKTADADSPVTNPKPPPTKTRTSRNRRPARGVKAKPAGSETEKTTANSDAPSSKSEAGEGAEKPNEPKPSATEAKTKTTTAATDKQQGAVTEPQAGAHLIIEETDGTRIDRPMSTIRRVIIDNGTIVMFLKSGKIERVPMTIVARMTIQP